MQRCLALPVPGIFNRGWYLCVQSSWEERHFDEESEAEATGRATGWGCDGCDLVIAMGMSIANCLPEGNNGYSPVRIHGDFMEI